MNKRIEEIYLNHRQGLFSLAVSVTGSHQLAEDSIQNAFARLFSHSIPESGDVAYVYRSVRNSAIDTVRHHQRQSKLRESLFENGTWAERQEPAHDTLVAQERVAILQAAIDDLDDHDREAVVLKSLAGLTFEQAGNVANTSPKTIATRYRRALKKLEQKLEGQL
jgi:RNA polymerase sigma-70 factor (ECF subfamily)